MFSKKPRGAVTQQDKKNGLASIFVMFLGLCTTLGVGAYAYKNSFFEEEAKQKAEIQKAKDYQVTPKVEEENTDYEFYSVLPEESIPTTMNELESTVDDDITILSKDELLAEDTENFRPDIVVTDTDDITVDTSTNLDNENTDTDENSVLPVAPVTNTYSSNSRQFSAQSERSSASRVQSRLQKEQSRSEKRSSNKASSKSTTKQRTNDKDIVIVYNGNNKKVQHTTPTQAVSKNTEQSVTMQKPKIKYPVYDDQSLANNSVHQTNAAPQQQNVQEAVQAPVNNVQKTTSAVAPVVTKKASTAKKPEGTKQQQAEKKTTYILQINSYTDANKADRRRAQVIMTGVDANVQRTQQGVYKVVSKTMTTPKQVIQAQHRLQKSGIESVIIEQRR